MLPPISKLFLLMGSVNALIAVMLGAFAAHGLKKILSAELLAIFSTGVQYHFYHALGLLLVGLMAAQLSSAVLIKFAGWLMFIGILIFSGSLYVLAITGIRWIGAITPVGGLSFITAWALLAWAVYKG